MATPWLSILIPVFNVKDYLDDCFQSILSQCDENIEIIALDDQSTDGSFEYLHALAAKSPHPIKILQHSHNRGLSAARNSLVAAATGEYVWFLDSDDVLVDGAVNQLWKIVGRYSPDLVMCDYQMWRPDVKTITPKHHKERHVKSFEGVANCLRYNSESLFKGLYARGKLHSWSKVSKRSLWIDGLQFPEGRYFEDMVTTPRLALKISSYYYCPNVWVRYRQREGSILARFNPKKIDDMMSGLDGVLALWEKKNPNMSLYARYIFIRYCIKIYIYALKEMKKVGITDTSMLRAYRSCLFKSVGMSKLGLIKHYVLVGDFFRLIKVLRVLA